MSNETENYETSKRDTVETKFPDIQKILDDAVNNENIGRHGPFWRGVTRDEFVVKQVFGCPIIHKEGDRFVGSESLLVKILRDPVEDCNTRLRPQMPVGFPALDEEKVNTIEKWIDDQCPA